MGFVADCTFVKGEGLMGILYEDQLTTPKRDQLLWNTVVKLLSPTTTLKSFSKQTSNRLFQSYCYTWRTFLQNWSAPHPHPAPPTSCKKRQARTVQEPFPPPSSLFSYRPTNTPHPNDHAGLALRFQVLVARDEHLLAAVGA